MHRILLLIFLAFYSVSFGQTVEVTGRCIDLRGEPLFNVKVVSAQSNERGTYTDSLGRYRLSFTDQTEAYIRYSFVGEQYGQTITFSGSNSVQLKDMTFKVQTQDDIIITRQNKNPFEVERLPLTDIQNLPAPSIEKYLVFSTPAVSNNELTTNYNVRGGSYDENLVYVNGFNVYRPFLTRSGQQEGMSFINTALVQSIQFSAGGFNSEYGDKLSSVLDITYKTPDSLRGSAMASLLGVEAHLEHAVTNRFNFLVGARYRSNGYLLNSLPTKGAYNPVFWDAQFLTNYAVTEKLTWSLIGHFSSNNYRFAPQTSQTDFGTANEAYSFNIYFDGQEQTRFQTMMGGTSLKWEVSPKTNLEWYATIFNSDEREYFDIQGQYYINELETDPSKEEFGDSVAVLGVGTFLNHARNRLNATIMNVYHHGDHTFMRGYVPGDSSRLQSHALKWGVNFQMDQFDDVLSEWRMIDSAGYSLPQSNDGNIELFETIKGKLNLEAQRYTSFVQMNSSWSKIKRNLPVEVSKKFKWKDSLGRVQKQVKTFHDTILESTSRWALSIGTRGGYTSANNEFFITPRATVQYFPRAYMVKDGKIRRRDVTLRFATGMYYQPPFYREFRTFDGNLNLDVLAQKSLHFVAGTDVYFNMWNREVPFKFTAEAYYKYLWDVNTYEIENVRTRYYADNNVVGYAYGLDMNIHGEFVPGIESFFKLGLLQTKEDVLDDYYWEFYNAAGERIIFGYSEDQVVVDSARIEPGFIPRPTDQFINFAALVQDRMPTYESFTVQMGLQFGSRLPYGPPDFNRYKDTLRIKSYFRVDIGMSYDFLYRYKERRAAYLMAKKSDPNASKTYKENFWSKRFSDAIVSFEVFNLLGVNNVLSKQWVQDVSGQYYSIPNYLTQRRFNLKLILRF